MEKCKRNYKIRILCDLSKPLNALNNLNNLCFCKKKEANTWHQGQRKIELNKQFNSHIRIIKG
uniref:Uncharacterized protein n=1 Tax=Glossina brevipalpis TaxID=37001 RepID=A0A1A9W0M3_9MUSC